MGWLIEAAFPGGKGSANRIAQAMEVLPGWPKAGLKVGSLRNNIDFLDKGERTDWWLSPKGAPYLPLLAEVAKLSLVEMRARIESAAPAEDDPDRWFHFELFPHLAPIDLDEERPFPGVPGELLEGDGPVERVWWVAPPGAGRTLVGRWLERSQGWRVCRDTEEIGERCFVELPASPEPVSARARRAIVACPTPPPPDDASRWQVVTTPKGWQPALLEWVSSRLEGGGRLTQDLLAGLMDGTGGIGLAFANTVTPGQALELLAMMDLVGVRASAESCPPIDRLKAWVQVHASRRDRAVRPATRAFLRDHGAPLIVEMELNRRLQDLPLSANSLTTCVPASRPPPSADTVLEQMELGGEAAVRAVLKPEASDLVAGMEALRWILPEGWGFPSMVLADLAAAVADHAARLPVDELGAVLRRGDLAGPLLHALAEPSALEGLCVQLPGLDIALADSALVIDAVVKAAVLAVAQGAPVSASATEILTGALIRVTPERGLCATRLGQNGGLREEYGWTALGKVIFSGSALPFDEMMVQHLLLLCGSGSVEPQFAALRDLAVRVLIDGRFVPQAASPLIGWASAWAEEEEVVVDRYKLVVLADLPSLGVLADLCAAAGALFAPVVKALWSVWLDRPDSLPWRPAAPLSSGERELLAQAWGPFPVGALDERHISAIEGAVAKGMPVPDAVVVQAFRLAPLASAGTKLAKKLGNVQLVSFLDDNSREVTTAAHGELWEREPAEHLARLAGRFATEPAEARKQWLCHVPDQHLASVIALFDGMDPVGGGRSELVYWLDGIQNRRRPGWEVAYPLWRKLALGEPAGRSG